MGRKLITVTPTHSPTDWSRDKKHRPASKTTHLHTCEPWPKLFMCSSVLDLLRKSLRNEHNPIFSRSSFAPCCHGYTPTSRDILKHLKALVLNLMKQTNQFRFWADFRYSLVSYMFKTWCFFFGTKNDWCVVETEPGSDTGSFIRFWFSVCRVDVFLYLHFNSHTRSYNFPKRTYFICHTYQHYYNVGISYLEISVRAQSHKRRQFATYFAIWDSQELL